jgi:hypothetical protein
MQNIKIPTIETIEKHNEFDKKYISSLYTCCYYGEPNKKRYCNEFCTNNCYQKQKEYFEQYVACVRNPELLYIETTANGGLTYVKPPAMVSRYGSCNKFISKWVNDTDNKTFSNLNFYPDKSKCPKSTYNLFTGFAVDKVYIKQDDKTKEELVKPILNHFKDVFESAETVEYLLKHFAHTIKKPMNKIGVSVVIQGEQGTGKSFSIDSILVPLIGKNLYFYTCKPSDIAGEHSEGMVNKLITTVDEVSGKTSFDISEILKSLITQTTLQVNPKGIRPYEVNNFNIYYFTTNSKTPIKIEVGDRRYVVIKMLNTYKNNISYYKKLAKYMQRPDVLSAWYDYLMSIDINNYDFIKNRPQSKLYSEIIESCSSNIVKFLAESMTHFENNKESDDEQYTVKADQLFTYYGVWKTKTNHKDEHNTTSFGREISGIAGISKKRCTSGFKYIFDFKELTKHFSKNNLFGFGKDENGKQELSEVDKLNEIIARQDKELQDLKKELEKYRSKQNQQTVNISVNINREFDDNHDYGKLTADIFKVPKQKKVVGEEDEKPKKKKKTKVVKQDDNIDIYNAFDCFEKLL